MEARAGKVGSTPTQWPMSKPSLITVLARQGLAKVTIPVPAKLGLPPDRLSAPPSGDGTTAYCHACGKFYPRRPMNATPLTLAPTFNYVAHVGKHGVPHSPMRPQNNTSTRYEQQSNWGQLMREGVQS